MSDLDEEEEYTRQNSISMFVQNDESKNNIEDDIIAMNMAKLFQNEKKPVFDESPDIGKRKHLDK